MNHIRNYVGKDQLCAYSLTEGLCKNPFAALGALTCTAGFAGIIRSISMGLENGASSAAEAEMSKLGFVAIAGACSVFFAGCADLYLNDVKLSEEFSAVYTFDNDIQENTYDYIQTLLSGIQSMSEIGPQHTYNHAEQCFQCFQVVDFLIDVEELYLPEEYPKDLTGVKEALQELIETKEQFELQLSEDLSEEDKERIIIASNDVYDNLQIQSREILDIIYAQPDLVERASIRLFWQLLADEISDGENSGPMEGFEQYDFTQDLGSLNEGLDAWMVKNKDRLDEIKKIEWDEKCFITIPDQIGELRELEVFRLYKSDLLREIPASIGELSKLWTLSLIGNQLTSLPDSIGDLAGLGNLGISCSGLTELPESIGDLLELQTLSITMSRLSRLPASFSDLQCLKNLNLNGNPFEDLDEVKTLIRQLPALEKCDFYPKRITKALKAFHWIGQGMAGSLPLYPVIFGMGVIPASIAGVAQFFFNTTGDPYLGLSEDWIPA